MKLLYLLPSVPHPPDSGARMRNLGLLSLAGCRHHVDVLAFGREDATPGPVDGVATLTVVPPPRPRSAVRRAAAMARFPLPDMAHRLWSGRFAEAVADTAAAGGYDAVQAEGIEMARYLDVARAAAPATRSIYDAHNAEFLLQRRAASDALAGGSRRLPTAVYSRVQWRRLERFERAVVRSSALTLAVSEHDANQLRALAPGANVHVVPNGIDLARYVYRDPPERSEQSILFLGSLGYRPNAEAVAWLIDEVLPRLFERLPAARLFVVGHEPPPWLVAVGQRDDRVAVVGPVPDERPYLERCSLLVMPMRFGGGSRLKALVAFASGVPVVSTRFGVEGLDARAGRDYFLADSPDAWAATLANALESPGQRREVPRAARELVERCYAWPRLADDLDAAYDTLAHGSVTG